jgi:hypothetical protein
MADASINIPQTIHFQDGLFDLWPKESLTMGSLVPGPAVPSNHAFHPGDQIGRKQPQ